MLVPKTPSNNPVRKDPPIMTEKPTVYEYNKSQAPSAAESNADTQREDEWLNLDSTSSTGNTNVTKTPISSIMSVPSVHNLLTTPTNSNAPRAPLKNVPPLCRNTMANHSNKKLRSKCNQATRQILFEKTENILPFQMTYPQGYPQEKLQVGEKLQIRLNWVINILTKDGLGEFHAL